MSSERERVEGFGKLEDGLRQAGDWYRWGPYVSEQQRGTVREDNGADGNAWDYLPHDHARSRAYRWGEDVLHSTVHRADAGAGGTWRDEHHLDGSGRRARPGSEAASRESRR